MLILGDLQHPALHDRTELPELTYSASVATTTKAAGGMKMKLLLLVNNSS
jgi:hypothetical protein